MRSTLIELIRDAGRVGVVLGVAVLTLLGMVGCSRIETREPEQAPRRVENVRVDAIRYDVPNTWLYEVRLKDGTRCVYLSSAQGVTCEWRREATAVERAP